MKKVFKNSRKYAYEFGGYGAEEVEYEYDEEYELVGKDSHIVYGVIDNTNKIIKNQTSFYFDKKIAKGVASQMNKHISEKKKPYKVKKYYLINSKEMI